MGIGMDRVQWSTRVGNSHQTGNVTIAWAMKKPPAPVMPTVAISRGICEFASEGSGKSDKLMRDELTTVRRKSNHF